ncbi:MAG: hypothetical protein M0R80_25905 [Proteobacteria bacterium]|jgi:hypothetical protein|nr:hypothetical protein [Pseudomonadota bacterium]
MTPWQLWLHLDLGDEAVLGAIGEHSCASLSELMHQLCMADDPTLIAAPLPPPVPCVVAVDAPVLARDPSLARLVPDGAGCLLVAPSACSDDEIDAARIALDARPPWTVLCDSGLGGGFGRKAPYDEALEAIYECAAIVRFALYDAEALARAGARYRDALLRCHSFSGEDNSTSLTHYTLERALRWSPPGRNAHWRRIHTKKILRIDGPLLPEFRALIDALPRSPSGRRYDVEVLSYEDQEPLTSGKTWWAVYRFDWLVRRG